MRTDRKHTERRMVVVLWFVGAACIVFDVIVPVQIGRLTRLFGDSISPNSSTLFSCVALLVGAQLALSVAGYLKDRWSYGLYNAVLFRKTTRMFRRILRARPEFFQQEEVETITTRILEENDTAVRFRMQCGIDLPLALVSIAVVAALMLWKQWCLACCMLPTALLGSYVFVFTGPLRRSSQRVRDEWEALRGRAGETLANVGEIRGHCVHDHSENRFARQYERFCRTMASSRELQARAATVEPLVMLIQWGVLFGVGAVLCRPDSGLASVCGSATWGTVIEFLFLVRLFQRPLDTICRLVLMSPRAKESIRRLSVYEMVEVSPNGDAGSDCEVDTGECCGWKCERRHRTAAAQWKGHRSAVIASPGQEHRGGASDSRRLR